MHFYVRGVWEEELREISFASWLELKQKLGLKFGKDEYIQTNAVYGVPSNTQWLPKRALNLFVSDNPHYNVKGASEKLLDFYKTYDKKEDRPYWELTALRLAAILEVITSDPKYGIDPENVPILVKNSEAAFGKGVGENGE